MLRTGLMAALAMGLIVSTAGLANAQGRGGIGGGWGGVELLLNPIVQRDLKLDGPGIQKARSLVQEQGSKRKSLNSLLEGLDGEDRANKVRELAAAYAEHEDKAIEGLLGPDQFARFRQIDLQQRGATAMTDPSVAKALRLSPEQSQALEPLLNRSVLRLREAAATSRGDRRVAFGKIQAVRQETDAAAVALLAEDQKTTWREMTGEPLDLNQAAHAAR